MNDTFVPVYGWDTHEDYFGPYSSDLDIIGKHSIISSPHSSCFIIMIYFVDYPDKFSLNVDEPLIAETFNGVYEIIPRLVNGRPMWITNSFLTQLRSLENGILFQNFSL